MDRRLRSTKLYETGLKAFHAADGIEPECVIYAVAVMLDEALNGSKRGKAKAAGKSKAPFTSVQLYEKLKAELPDLFHYEPIDNQWWGRMNRDIGQMNLPPETLEKLVTWLEAKAPDWKSDVLPFSAMVQNFRKWVVQALNDDFGPSNTNRFNKAPQAEHGFVRGAKPKGR